MQRSSGLPCRYVHFLCAVCREDEGGGLEAEPEGEKERQQDIAREGAACGSVGGNHNGRVRTRYVTYREGGASRHEVHNV